MLKKKKAAFMEIYAKSLRRTKSSPDLKHLSPQS